MCTKHCAGAFSNNVKHYKNEIAEFSKTKNYIQILYK